MSVDGPRLLRSGDVARRLGISSERVRQLAREGRLPIAEVVHGPAGKAWRRFDAAAVEAFAATYRRQAPPAD